MREYSASVIRFAYLSVWRCIINLDTWGRIGKLECNFILSKDNFDYAYVQVCMTIMNDINTEDHQNRTRHYSPYTFHHSNSRHCNQTHSS